MDKQKLKADLIQFIYLNLKKIFGAVIGLIIGILILVIGFLKL